MTDGASSPSEVGLGTGPGWLLGGAIGGIVGSVLFGAVLWIVDPAIITEAIPALYGLEPGSIGWAFHIGHGLIFGVIFGAITSREPVLGVLAADVETPFIDALGLSTRFALAGFAYGLAVFATLPIVMVAIDQAGLVADLDFPLGAPHSLLGHLLYGTLLGYLFSLFVDVAPAAESADDPLEGDAGGPPG